MKKQRIIIVLCFVVSMVYSQDYKFGKVSKAELEETSYSRDSSANAAVLYKNQYIYFNYSQENGFVQVNEIHERIKIYNKKGFDWATKKIRLYNRSNSNSEDLISLKGYTFNLDNDKIVKDKLKKDGQFEEEINKYWKNSSFTMPNIKEGCVIEYSYKIESPYRQIDDIDFQYTIPINKFDFRVKTPEYYFYNKLLNPKAKYAPKLSMSQENRTITLRSRSRGSTRNVSGSSFSQENITLKENIITSNVTHIPALKDEPFVDNLDNYRSKLILELVTVNFPNRPLENYATSWNKVAQSIYKNPSFGEQLQKSGYYKNDIDALTAGISSQEKKTALIYDYVKSKVKWNDFYGYTSADGLKKAYKDGVGNSGDINLMLTSMLRHAGVNANPVLVSTKNNGVPLLPTRTGFNYLICLVEGDNPVFLDATEKFCSPNILPSRALNWQGRIIRKDGSSDWINLIPNKSSKEVTSLNVKINDDFSVNGKVRSQFTDYQAMRYRKRFNNTSKEDHIKYLEKDNGEIEISNVEVKNKDAVESPILTSYEYELFDAVEDIGGKLYFSPLLFLANEENPFKQETRDYPIDFQYPIADKYIVNIMIPEGYEVESLPKNEAFAFNDTAGKYTYLINQNGKFLQLSINFNLNLAFVIPSDYTYFRSFYKLLTEKQAEKIVLKKTEP